MAKLTAILLVRNEELQLSSCLSSISGICDSVIVLDTGSTDGTISILNSETRFNNFHWESYELDGFGSARQKLLSLVETEWTLWIDADETVSPELQEWLANIPNSNNGYEIEFENRVLGRTMKCKELTGEKKLRLFKTKSAKFTDSALHETVEVEGSIATADGKIIHNTMTSWKQYLKKVDHYTTLDAKNSTKRFNLLHLFFTGPAVFFKQYFWHTTFRDGYPGFAWALMSAISSIKKDWKLLRR
jgi:glycosyltransferase involved in cell wall biosynthesis